MFKKTGAKLSGGKSDQEEGIQSQGEKEKKEREEREKTKREEREYGEKRKERGEREKKEERERREERGKCWKKREEKGENESRRKLKTHMHRSVATFCNGCSIRMRRITKEISALSSALPPSYHSSICVRVDETRPDVIKALIIGPEDTPYANGCFIFDIFLGTGVSQLVACDGSIRENETRPVAHLGSEPLPCLIYTRL